MRPPRSTRTIPYSIPASPDGVLMSGKCIIVPDQEKTHMSPGDTLILRRQDFATILKFWRRHDTTARRTRRQDRINALFLFLMRNSLPR